MFVCPDSQEIHLQRTVISKKSNCVFQHLNNPCSCSENSISKQTEYLNLTRIFAYRCCDFSSFLNDSLFSYINDNENVLSSTQMYKEQWLVLLKPRQNDWQLANDIFICIFLYILQGIWTTFVPKDQINNPALVPIMAWQQPEWQIIIRTNYG